jgi:WD40 repeat protein
VPDGERFFTTHVDGTVRLWHRQAWFPTLTLSVEKAVISGDGRFVLGTTAAEPVRLWDTETGQPRATLEGSAGKIATLALGPDGARAAVSFVNGVVRLWNSKIGTQSGQLGEAAAKTRALAFDAGGSQLATGSEDGKVLFWDVSDGSLLGMWPVSHERISGLLFHPDGM